MKYEVKEKKDGKVTIEFVLDAAEWEAEVEKAYQKNKGKYKKEGFRQGKVPRKVLEQTYGDTLFYEEAFNDCAATYYSEMLQKEPEIYPVEYPLVDIKSIGKDKGVVFTATVTVMPEIKLGEYKGLTVKKNAVKVGASEVNSEIDTLREKQARFVEVTDRAAKLGDLVNLDYSGSVDGVKFDGGTAANQELELGSHSFIEGFEDQMVGMRVGDERDLHVKFPDNYHAANLAGKEAIFAVKLLGIREKQLPDLDDAFAKDVSEFETLTDLKADIKKKKTEAAEKQASIDAENKLVEQIVDNAEIKIPDCMIESQIDSFVEDIRHRLSHQGLNFEDYLKYTGSTLEEYRKSRRADAERHVKTSLTLSKIIEAENVKVTDEAYDAKISELANYMNKSVDEVKKTMQPGQDEFIRQNVLTELLMAKLKELNTIE